MSDHTQAPDTLKEPIDRADVKVDSADSEKRDSGFTLGASTLDDARLTPEEK